MQSAARTRRVRRRRSNPGGKGSAEKDDRERSNLRSSAGGVSDPIAAVLMHAIRIDNLDDPRLAPYRALKDRELASEGKLFIAEGQHVVERLLNSDFQAESVLLSERRIAVFADKVPPHV